MTQPVDEGIQIGKTAPLARRQDCLYLEAAAGALIPTTNQVGTAVAVAGLLPVVGCLSFTGHVVVLGMVASMKIKRSIIGYRPFTVRAAMEEKSRLAARAPSHGTGVWYR